MIISQKGVSMTIKKQYTDIHLHMDNLVEQYKTLTEEIESLMALKNEKIASIEIECDSKVNKKKEMQSLISAELRTLASQVPQKESKSQSKVELLSGNVVIKKPTKTLVADKDKLIEWAKANAMNDYIDEKVVHTFKWKELKSDLDIVDGQVVNRLTGEIMNDCVGIEEKQEEVVIK